MFETVPQLLNVPGTPVEQVVYTEAQDPQISYEIISIVSLPQRVSIHDGHPLSLSSIKGVFFSSPAPTSRVRPACPHPAPPRPMGGPELRPRPLPTSPTAEAPPPTARRPGAARGGRAGTDAGGGGPRDVGWGRDLAGRRDGRSPGGASDFCSHKPCLGGRGAGPGAARSARVAAAGAPALPRTVGRGARQPPAEHGALDAVALLPARGGLGAGALHHLRGRLVLLRVRGGALRV